MLEVRFARFSKARLWQNEDPFSGSVRAVSIALEVMVPRGGMSEYGLLGGRLYATSSRAITLEMTESRGPWADPLVRRIDQVEIGLPSEYHSEILRRGRAKAAREELAAGVVFDRAAHGMVGSSSSCFGALAELIVELLARPDRSGREEQLVEMLTSYFHPRR